MSQHRPTISVLRPDQYSSIREYVKSRHPIGSLRAAPLQKKSLQNQPTTLNLTPLHPQRSIPHTRAAHSSPQIIPSRFRKNIASHVPITLSCRLLIPCFLIGHFHVSPCIFSFAVLRKSSDGRTKWCAFVRCMVRETSLPCHLYVSLKFLDE